MIAGDLLGPAADVLRRCQMPPDEIRWVLAAEDPAVIHMILELTQHEKPTLFPGVARQYGAGKPPPQVAKFDQ